MGRDVDTLWLSHHLKVLRSPDSDAEGGSGEEECGYESLEGE